MGIAHSGSLLVCVCVWGGGGRGTRLVCTYMYLYIDLVRDKCNGMMFACILVKCWTLWGERERGELWERKLMCKNKKHQSAKIFGALD